MDYSRFFEIYNNIPDKIRKEVVVVVDDKPYSWNAVYIELKSGSELGQIMYDKLVNMEII